MFEIKVPLAAKIIAAILPIGVLVGGFIYLSVRSDRMTKKFYKSEIASVVIDRSDWKKRSIDFYLADGIKLNFLSPAGEKIAIGDSVYKSKNTFIYSVYRTGGTGQYELIANYNYLKNY